MSSEFFDDVVEEMVVRRKQLEAYIRKHPDFKTSFAPVSLQAGAPEIVIRMADASVKTGLGPMASVAGILAQYGVDRALSLGASESIVENGGDMVVAVSSPVSIGIHTIDKKFSDKLAFRIESSKRLAICSSSSVMGHSVSLGNCGLATAVSEDAALADSAATLLCNCISSVKDMENALEKVGRITGILGVMAIHDGRMGMFGDLPQLIKNEDSDTRLKVTRDRRSN
ncbi:MAG: UPF0280 family protein [Deltaproteobacteria bacterium]|nr:UPF0280 family protein [Deltaproteobacteria bacterium]MBN2674122.1 UPF0280 family protein [Deltaproteobacteria bacterium]